MCKFNGYLRIVILLGVFWMAAIGCQTLPKHPSLRDAKLPKLIQTRDFFFSDKKKFGFRVSPGGGKIAYFELYNRRLFIVVKNIDSEKTRSFQLTPNGGISNLVWSSDSRHLFYYEDQEGNENYQIFYLDTRKNSGSPKFLVGFDGARTRIARTIKNDPENIIVTHNHRDKSVPDLFKINIKNGEQTLIAQNPGDVSQWIIDEDGVLKARVRKNTKGVSFLEILSDSPERWNQCFSWSEDEYVRVLDFTKNKKDFWLLSNHGRDKVALTKLNGQTGEEKLIYEDPQVDIEHVILSYKSKEPLLAYFNPGYQKIHYFDSRMEEALSIFKHGHRMSLLLTSKDHQDNMFTVTTLTDKGARYWSFDREKGVKVLIGEKKITEHAELLSSMKPISFKSRDGLTIHGYLTIPKGTSGKNLPLVLLVHGGPWSRDRWGYNAIVQLAANRGYAVLQVNFRGSKGYGRKFLEAGAGEWAGKMHDDLIDGIQWAIDSGIADPQKIAICGASYGGYAALVGLTFTPDTFACGVDLYGPSNLVTLLKSVPDYWKLNMPMFYKHVGNPNNEEDRRRMKAKSPLYHVDKITKPLMIVQGGKDVRVKPEESEQIVQALEEAGKEVNYIFFKLEGHGVRKWNNMLHTISQMEKFYAKHLGGRDPIFEY
ncbi:alpha/beta fold hydrolase [Thermodesulfobacteriota bacterium]